MRTGITLPRNAPPQTFDTLHLKGDLGILNRNRLHFWNLISHKINLSWFPNSGLGTHFEALSRGVIRDQLSKLPHVAAKRSFANVLSQAGAWERGKVGVNSIVTTF